MDAQRLLAPLDEERDAIRQLTEYRTPALLADAIRRVDSAVDRVLRAMLRADPAASDAARIEAFSPGLPFEEVVAALRRADTISVELAGGARHLRIAAERALDGSVTAADADLARDVLRRIADSVRVPEPGPGAGQEPVPADRPEPEEAGRPGARSLTWIALLLLAGGGFAWFTLRDRSPRAAAGIAAFEAGRLLEAEAVFRARTEAGVADVTDWLFLGRIQRRSGRFDESAAALRMAAGADPADADVRRELGWLFLDLDRPTAAVEQFRLAIEAVPGEPLAWVGLIRALRAAGDASAAEWLARAPPAARALLDPAQNRSPGR